MLKTSNNKQNNQTILKEHIDEHYDPTQEEIREYALYIGIDPDKVNKEKMKDVMGEYYLIRNWNFCGWRKKD